MSYIKWLFCTSTLIEGVNTSAKNVILFDKKKGLKQIDYFDYRNIAGRSGRMKQHFIGNVIKFETEPEQIELDLNIPLFDQEKAPLEILVSLSESQIDPIGRTRLKQFNEFPMDLQELLKKNTGILLEGQKGIINKIEQDIPYYHKYLSWINMPSSFEEMSVVIELCWSFLLTQGDKPYIPKIGRLTARWLASFAYSYVKTKSVGAMIKQYTEEKFWKEKIPDFQERSNITTYAILHIVRHWFDYKLPKWIMTVSNIQEYVFKKHDLSCGNYTYTASNIENGFLHPSIYTLSEYGIPTTALKKLHNIINTNDPVDENLRKIKAMDKNRLISLGLLKYEIDKIEG